MTYAVQYKIHCKAYSLIECTIDTKVYKIDQ